MNQNVTQREVRDIRSKRCFYKFLPIKKERKENRKIKSSLGLFGSHKKCQVRSVSSFQDIINHSNMPLCPILIDFVSVTSDVM